MDNKLTQQELAEFAAWTADQQKIGYEDFLDAYEACQAELAKLNKVV